MRAAVAHYNTGVLHDNSERWQAAASCYRKYLAALRELEGMPDTPASPPGSISMRSAMSGMPDLSEGSMLSERATSGARKAALALGYNALAIATAAAGGAEQSLQWHAEHAKVAPTPLGRAVALVNAGIVHRQLGALDDSDACFKAAHKLAVAEGDAAAEMLTAGHLGLNAAMVIASQAGKGDDGHDAAPGATGLSAAPSPPLQPRPPSATAPSGRPAGRSVTRAKAAPSAARADDTAAAVSDGALISRADAAAKAYRFSIARPVASQLRVGQLTPLDAERAREGLYAALKLQSAKDDPRNVCMIRRALGVLAAVRGAPQEAQGHFEAALATEQAVSASASTAGAAAAASHIGVSLGMQLAASKLEEAAAAALASAARQRQSAIAAAKRKST